jgi:hypothetical protein
MRLALSILLLSGGGAFAQDAATSLDEMRAKGLPPHQLQAINAIGSNILQAKQMGRTQTDPNDKDLLNELRSTAGKLVAAENLSSANISLSSDAQAATAANDWQAANDAARKSAQAAAWDVVGKLNQASSQLLASGNSKAKQQIVSGGMPIGQQRGGLYQQWANQLEVVINNTNSPDRISQLLALQSQLQPGQRSVTATPTTLGTPSMQAMTWNAPPAVAEPQPAGSGKKTKKH